MCSRCLRSSISLVAVGILGLGIISEYIGRIYQEVRRRPRFVIREVVEKLDG